MKDCPLNARPKSTIHTWQTKKSVNFEVSLLKPSKAVVFPMINCFFGMNQTDQLKNWAIKQVSE